MKELADGRIFAPDELVQERLVDALGWEKDAKAELGVLAGAKRPDKLATEAIGNRVYWTERWSTPAVIAIVGAYGSIMSGKSERSITQPAHDGLRDGREAAQGGFALPRRSRDRFPRRQRGRLGARER